MPVSDIMINCCLLFCSVVRCSLFTSVVFILLGCKY